MDTRTALGALRQLQHQHEALQHVAAILATATRVESELEALQRRYDEVASRVEAIEGERLHRLAEADAARQEAERVVAEAKTRAETAVADMAQKSQVALAEWKHKVQAAKAEHESLLHQHQAALASLEGRERDLRVAVGRLTEERDAIRTRLRALA